MADQIRILRLHGISRDAWKRFGKSGFVHWDFEIPGYKFNMTDINAAMGIHQLKKAGHFLQLRKQYASLYDQAFSKIPELEILETRDYAEPSHHLYVIALRLEQLAVTRDEFIDAIQSTGIGVAVHYRALHLQPFFQKENRVKVDTFPVATRYSESVVSLPIYPRMSVKEVERVIGVVTDLVARYRR